MAAIESIKTQYDIAENLDFDGLIAEEAANTKRKTGSFTGTGVKWYTRRDGSGERVCKVEYLTPRTAPKKKLIWGGKPVEIGDDMVLKTELFPFTPEGLRAAVAFRMAHNEW